MSGDNEQAISENSKIPCVEVLVSGNYNAINPSLHWTLSVYSLENQPVTTDRFRHADTFHFMLFDWHRTIKILLDENLVHYTVVQHFGAETIYQETFCSAADPSDYISPRNAPQQGHAHAHYATRPHAESGELLPDEI